MSDRETQILQALSGRLTAAREAELVEELAYIRQERTAKVAEDRALGFAEEVREAHLTPVPAFERHSASTEWLADVTGTLSDPEAITSSMRTEASLWWSNLHEAVKADPEELAIQCTGQARRLAGGYGDQFEVAEKAYVDHIAHLRSREAVDDTQNGDATSGLPTGVENDDVAFPLEHEAPQPAKVDLKETPPSLSGGSAPEGDSAPQLVNPEADQRHDSHTDTTLPKATDTPVDNSTSDGDVQWNKSSNLRIARALHEVADEIHRVWRGQGGVHYTAKPYLDAMRSLQSVNDRYGEDSGKHVVAYFLSNASQFRGPDAKRLKAELKDHLSGKATASLSVQAAYEASGDDYIDFSQRLDHLYQANVISGDQAREALGYAVMTSLGAVTAGDKPPWFDKSQKSPEKSDGDKPGSGKTDDPMGKGAHPAKDSGSGEDDSGGKDDKADHSTNSDSGDKDSGDKGSSDKDSSSDSGDSSSSGKDSFSCSCDKSSGKCTCKSASLLGSPVTQAFRARVQANLGALPFVQADDAPKRCPRTKNMGFQQNANGYGSSPRYGRCTLPAGHEGDHEFDPSRTFPDPVGY